MAQIKNGKLIGTISTETFGKVSLHVKAGVQQVRSATADSNDPQSASQMYQRLKMLTTAPLYGVLKEATALGWENIKDGCSQYNMFTGLAMKATPFGITQQLHQKGAGIAWPAQITSGSLPVIVMNNKETNIALSGLSSITSSTTVAQLAKAIVDGNPGVWEYDDELAFVEVRQMVDAEGTPKIACTRSAVILDEDSTETLASLPSMKGFSASTNGFLALNGEPTTGGFAYIHSRMQDGKMLVSSQSLVCNNDAILQAYSEPAKLRAAAKSLGADLTSEKFLKPTSAQGRKSLAAFGINYSRIKGMVAGVTEGIMALEFDGATYFAGDEPFILDSETGNILVTVTDGSKLGTTVTAKINGTTVTSPTIAGNVVTLPIPSTLDGDYAETILITGGSKNWKFEF